jgi:SAM-dependent methyltransferase
MSSIENYDSISDAFAEFVVDDVSKKYVQYPWAVRQLPGRISGARILDIGCGEGSLSRILARKGARVVGYDNSVKQINRARNAESSNDLDITYIVADPDDITGKLVQNHNAFDAAVAITVLHYASDTAHLVSFFSSTFRLLRPGGLFIALVFNPDFERVGQRLYDRKYSVEIDGRLRVDFLGAAGAHCSAHFTRFSRRDYETSASAARWPALEWLPVNVAPEGRAALGEFWQGFEEDCPYCGFKLEKPGGN